MGATPLRACILIAALTLAAACGGSSEPPVIATWRALAAERWYTCGLTTTDETFCWGGVPGYRDPMPLEDSLIPISAVPLLVPGGHRFTEITVGETPMCALNEERAAYCWGSNQVGEVGDGSHLAKRGPSAVVGGLRWRMLSAGSSHVCGLTTDDQAYCWGNQFRGALGNGELNGTSPQPVAVQGAHEFLSIQAGGGFSCALTADGEAYCWGVNDYGRLGDGQPPAPFLESATPLPVVGGHRFTSLALSTYHTCGIVADARAYCWGESFVGQLGNGSTEPTSIPTPVSGDHRWRALSLGSSHSCGITTDGALYCWGGNERGQFGNGTVTDVTTTPLLIDDTGVYVSIVAGGFHTCGITVAGTAFCWGYGEYGQLGNGVMNNNPRPTQVVARE